MSEVYRVEIERLPEDCPACIDYGHRFKIDITVVGRRVQGKTVPAQDHEGVREVVNEALTELSSRHGLPGPCVRNTSVEDATGLFSTADVLGATSVVEFLRRGG